MNGTATPRSLVVLAPLGALLALVLAVQPAQASVLVTTTEDCAEEVISQPFLPWDDNADYTPLPGGDFEGGSTAWSLDDAALAAGNEPWKVRNPADASSLAIDGGGSATSPPICVGFDHPTMRFFVRSQGSPLVQLLSLMTVEVLFKDAGGTTRSLPVGIIKAPMPWKPSYKVPIIANFFALDPNARVAVSFRFRAIGGADWQVDDVYVDPKSRR